ncbi:hypothetical protein RISK_006392 [Rhodopirellula islandica]|uniref:Uncharacterized protein n=1 Tax=Rhodopirellula islandica TaxID=595434 RepID=A0A0J1B3X8_RHOIS|nr:hypothetical protein RISK_006392 [Rhodopirellula islandica]
MTTHKGDCADRPIANVKTRPSLEALSPSHHAVCKLASISARAKLLGTH